MNAFIDESGILVSWGYAESNNDDTLVEVPEDFNEAPGSVQYVNGAWVPYAPPANYVPDNTVSRDALMDAATAATAGMSDAYVAGILGDADKAKFQAWAAYKLALSKVDLTQQSPSWPTLPA